MMIARETSRIGNSAAINYERSWRQNRYANRLPSIKQKACAY